MSHLSYKTVSANSETVSKEWLLIDAEGQPLGRLSSKIASLIRGKHKVDYTPHVDCGDNVVVINAEKVTLSGNKWENKEYIRHTGYPGGQRSINASSLLKKFPERLVEKAVKVCFLKIDLEKNYLVICTSSLVKTTIKKLKNQKK